MFVGGFVGVHICARRRQASVLLGKRRGRGKQITVSDYPTGFCSVQTIVVVMGSTPGSLMSAHCTKRRLKGDEGHKLYLRNLSLSFNTTRPR